MLKVGDKVELRTKDAFYAVATIDSLGDKTIGVSYKRCDEKMVVHEKTDVVMRKHIKKLIKLR